MGMPRLWKQDSQRQNGEAGAFNCLLSGLSTISGRYNTTMEGPTVFATQQMLQPFKGKKIKGASGNTVLGTEQFVNKQIKDIYSWGKHLVFQFDHFALRVHFMLAGTYEGEVDGKMIYGDYKKTRDMKLQFDFDNGFFAMYSCNLKLHPNTSNLKEAYDFTTDVMADEWDEEAAYKKVLKKQNAEISDVLLDQKIFTGVGNKIRNEELFNKKIPPMQLVKDIEEPTLRKLVHDVVKLSRQFYEWRKIDELNNGMHWKIYKKKICPVCGGEVKHAYTGKQKRSSYWCPVCQPQTSLGLF